MDFDQTLSEFEEQITSFYNRNPSRAEAEKELTAHCTEMLGALEGMLPILGDYPMYAGVAFYGRMQIANRRLITSLSEGGADADEAIAELRSAKALRIAASARAGWELLLEHNPQALWCAIRLNALASIAIPRDRADDDDEDEDDEWDEDDCDDDTDCDETE